MALFLVTYDISTRADDDRQALRKTLENGAWVQVSESSYVVQRYGTTSKELHQSLCSTLTKAPLSLYVFRLAEDFYGEGKDDCVQKWICHAYDSFPKGV